METLPSGIKKVEASDNAVIENFNVNADLLDARLRNYTKEIDVASKDATSGIYKIVRYKRSDNTLYLVATLSNPDVNGYFQTDTWQFYDAAGATVVKTVTWTLVYDADGIVTSATPSAA